MIRVTGILASSIQNSAPVDERSVSLTVSSLGVLTFLTQGKSVTIDPALINKPDLVAGYITSRADIELVWDSERFNTRTACSSVADRKSVYNVDDYVFVVGYDVDGIYVCVNTPLSGAPSNCEFVQLSNDEWKALRSRVWMKNQSAGMSALIKKQNAKRKLLANVKPEDALAALENQVDLLTQLVGALINGNAAPSWANDLMTLVQNKGSNTLRTTEEMLQAIDAEKTHIRSLQSEYYAERN